MYHERMLSPSLALREHTSSASDDVAEWAEGIACGSRSRPRYDNSLNFRVQQSSSQQPQLPLQQLTGHRAAAVRNSSNYRNIQGRLAQRQRRTGPGTHEAVLVVHSRLCSALL